MYSTCSLDFQALGGSKVTLQFVRVEGESLEIEATVHVHTCTCTCMYIDMYIVPAHVYLCDSVMADSLVGEHCLTQPLHRLLHHYMEHRHLEQPA